MVYLFTLGRTFDLCFAELQAIFKINKIAHKILHQIENHVVVETETPIDVEVLIKQSGGIIKIAKQFLNSKFEIRNSKQILNLKFKNQNDKNIHCSNEAMKQCSNGTYHNFGISIVGFNTNIKELCEDLKGQIGLHYTLPKDGSELSSAQVFNKKILEISIVKIENKFFVFQTQAVQNVDYWAKKDAGRPFIDDRLGMLPLKAARMMINLGRGREGIGGQVMLDPFCGMGSILEEAVDAGFQNIIGGDINAQVLDKCRKNLDWFQKSFNYQNIEVKLIESDAANISQKLNGQKVDLIVTEPFMGDARKIQNLISENLLEIRENQNVNKQKHTNYKGNANKQISNIMGGLEKMYLGALKDWKRILGANGTVCIIVPEITIGNRVFTIPFVEMCGKLGYNIIIGPLEYAREKAVVRRKIYIVRNSK